MGIILEPEIIEKGSDEGKKLECVAAMLTAVSPHSNCKYAVQDVYFDFGQDWMWTTIVRRGWHEAQVLSPAQWSAILLADGLVELAKVTEDIRADIFFGDN